MSKKIITIEEVVHARVSELLSEELYTMTDREYSRFHEKKCEELLEAWYIDEELAHVMNSPYNV